MDISQVEKEILQKLAHEYAEIAALGVHKEKINLWRALNRGEMQRPMVLIDQIPWHEMNIDDQLTLRVENPYFRAVEKQLRQTIYKWKYMPVDMVIEPFITIPKVIVNRGYGIKIDEETSETSAENDIVSHSYTNQITTQEDIEKIKDMVLQFDNKETLHRLEAAQDIFGSIIPVKLSGVDFHLGVWDKLSMLMGIEDIYFDIIDRPEFVHDIMERMITATLYGIEEANRLKLHNDVANICHCSHIYTDQLLPAPGESGGATSENCWAFGMAQLFSSASPQTTAEFEMEYFKRLAPNFGMIYYGCCERLDDRLDVINQIPNIRKISCSPWSDREKFAEKIGSSIVMSNKPNPSFLATNTLELDAISADLNRTYDAAKANSVNLEFILKDLSTVGKKPQKLFDWANTAMKIVLA